MNKEKFWILGELALNDRSSANQVLLTAVMDAWFLENNL